ncbi:Thioredoxin family protein [Flavobacterium limnosediminis JC2902]|uniref:Thioredoxin family protein n=1 Tax=Flavobacterium limnosediminis JC2902 TaxID=1341181 RepID=V6SQT5_9FLAO|nr:thioredoxin family protein [Flavobacterium limnosediminis]ESU28809.1 Thioredoxin family protein [Flavobacterium limnosediminis JC2902]
MKSKFIYLLLLFSMFAGAQETAKLNFQQSLEKAKTENKNVLLFFSGSDWCAPCVKFKKHFVETDQFKTFSTENLIVYNADFPRLKKNQLPTEITQENEKLAEKYNNDGLFPLILLMNNKGEVLKKWEHYPSETLEDFIAKLKG